MASKTTKPSSPVPRKRGPSLPLAVQKSMLQTLLSQQRYFPAGQYAGKAKPKDYATWVALEVFRQLAEEKGLTWQEGSMSRKRGFTPLLERIPAEGRILPDLDVPATLRGVRMELRRRLFAATYWVPVRQLNKVMVAGAWKAVHGKAPSDVQCRAYADQLDNLTAIPITAGLTFTHQTTAEVLLTHGVGKQMRHKGQRGLTINWKGLAEVVARLDEALPDAPPLKPDGLFD